MKKYRILVYENLSIGYCYLTEEIVEAKTESEAIKKVELILFEKRCIDDVSGLAYKIIKVS